MGSTKTAAVKDVLRAELERIEQRIPLRQRVRPTQDRVPACEETGLEADKALYDSSNGHC